MNALLNYATEFEVSLAKNGEMGVFSFAGNGLRVLCERSVVIFSLLICVVISYGENRMIYIWMIFVYYVTVVTTLSFPFSHSFLHFFGFQYC